jgi:hypothetical protein
MHMQMKEFITENHTQSSGLAQIMVSAWIENRLRDLEEKRDRMEAGIETGVLLAERYPHGYSLLRENDYWEQAWLGQILEEASEKPFLEVLSARYRRIDAENDIAMLSGSDARRRTYYRRKFEEGLLRELTREWTAIVKSVVKAVDPPSGSAEIRYQSTAGRAVKGA